MSPFISSSGLSPDSGEAEIQWAQVCLSRTELGVARSSYWSLPVGLYLSDSCCELSGDPHEVNCEQWGWRAAGNLLGPVHTGNKVEFDILCRSTLLPKSNVFHSVDFVETGDFCRQNVERPFDLTELTRLKFDFITSVYQPLVTRWESGEQPVVPLTSAFDTWRVYDILKILHSTHVSNYLVTIKTAVGTNDYFAFTACFWFC